MRARASKSWTALWLAVVACAAGCPDAPPSSSSEPDAAAGVDSSRELDAGVAMDSSVPIDSGRDTGASAVDSGGDSSSEAGVPHDSGQDAATDGGSPCPANNGGAACTGTEQRFVDKSPACYQCLVTGECIDNTVNGDTNKECGDLTGNATAGAKSGTAYSTLCLALLDCILAHGCASMDVNLCYCGDLGAGNACTSAASGANGACKQEEVDGANHLAGDPPSQVFPALGDLTNAAGRANQLFVCAKSNSCDKLCSGP